AGCLTANPPYAGLRQINLVPLGVCPLLFCITTNMADCLTANPPYAGSQAGAWERDNMADCLAANPPYAG
ncbi:MAG: hypothetical protein U1D70_08835, partial [Methylobacter sp.]|nr:hypothetical protein [Methylobacter sp.]